MYVEFDKKSGKPLYIQLYEAILEDITTGKLHNGVKLPARRTLSEELNISQNTVDGAYKMLLDTGYIISIPRQGYVVSFKSSAYDNLMPWEITAPETVVFSPNGTDTSYINRTAYAKILRDIVYNDGYDIFSYVDKGGEFVLRSEISKYLYSFHNIKSSPDRIIVGASAEYLLSSLAAIFFKETVFIMENPCDNHFYRTLTSYGKSVATLPTDKDEFDMDALYSSSGKILFIEPDARFPRSLALSDAERQEILDWASQSDDRYIIENCCDTEIQWNKNKSLYNLDKNNKVIYLGSFSRSFSPAVQTSYMILPPELLALWKKHHAYYYSLVSKTEQYALAEFIKKGYFTKHYKNMRRIYKDKRKYLTDCFTEAFGDKIKICGGAGSTYITAELEGMNAEEIKLLARQNGVKLLSENSYNVKKDTSPMKNDKLVIGFGDLQREKIKLGIHLLKDSLNYI